MKRWSAQQVKLETALSYFGHHLGKQIKDPENNSRKRKTKIPNFVTFRDRNNPEVYYGSCDNVSVKILKI